MPSAYIPALYLVLVPPQNLLDEQPNSRIHFLRKDVVDLVISPAFGACSRPELDVGLRPEKVLGCRRSYLKAGTDRAHYIDQHYVVRLKVLG